MSPPARISAVAPSHAPCPSSLDERLTRALASRGISDLYSHQAEAIEHALARRNVVVVTPTASGKTLCYNAPVLSAILQDPSRRALYLFPTKALAQDQLAELQVMCETIARDSREAGDDVQVGVFTYDGDTPQDARRAIRGRAHIVLSNPDMVHSGILPHHPRWAKLFENLRYVIIDELHAYRGVFGSHLCNVLRRCSLPPLRVLACFICSSATIANPRELAECHHRAAIRLRRSPRRRREALRLRNPPVVNHKFAALTSAKRDDCVRVPEAEPPIIVFAQSRSQPDPDDALKDDFEDAPRARGIRGIEAATRRCGGVRSKGCEREPSVRSCRRTLGWRHSAR
jgi:DEAD/DEAH box helicase domain-containing protein